MTSGQSNLTKKSHRSCTWMVQWYSLGGASMHPILGPPESTTQTASRSVWPFLYSSQRSVIGHVLSPKNCPLAWGNLDTHLIHGFLVHASPHPKWHLSWFNRFCRSAEYGRFNHICQPPGGANVHLM